MSAKTSPSSGFGLRMCIDVMPTILDAVVIRHRVEGGTMVA